MPQYEPDLIRLAVGKAFDALVPGGEMHLIGESYLEGAGFDDVAVHPFVPGLLSRVAGRKPS